jgi:glycosyltransferase involved in cell wall biosynthesis
LMQPVADSADNNLRPARALTLVASDVSATGGMERAAFELCARLLQRGWRLTVIARSCALPPSDRLRYVRIPAPSRPVSLALMCDFVFASLLVARVRDGIVQTNNPTIGNRVDVVHAHFCERAFRATGISRSRRASLAYRLNSALASWISVALERWSYRRGRVGRIVCVSQGLTRELVDFYPAVESLVSTIPNGVDRAKFRGTPSARDRIRTQLGAGHEDLIALFVGGDWHRKGLTCAIEGIAAAPGWSLVVLGAGDRPGFAALANDRGVADRVRFLGKVSDPVPYYLAADALLAPSHYEAFSLVALEGAAAGLPLIAPRMNGTEELISEGSNGWFTERDGDAIGARLRELRNDPALRATMGCAARTSAEPFDWERVVDRFEELYAQLGTSALNPG